MPTTTLRNSGITTAQGSIGVSKYGRTSYTTSTGNVIAVVYDTNVNSASVWGDKDGVAKFHIYEITPAGVSTLRKSIAAPAGGVHHYSVGQWGNDDLALAVVADDRASVRYARFVYTTWATPTWEVVGPWADYTVDEVEVDVSDGGMVTLALIMTTNVNKVSHHLYCRTTAGAWTHPFAGDSSASGSRAAGPDAISALSFEVSNGGREIVWAVGSGNSLSDYGVRFYYLRINEANGAVISGPNPNMTPLVYGAGEANKATSASKERHVKLFKTGNRTFFAGIAHGDVNRKQIALNCQVVLNPGVGANPLQGLTVSSVNLPYSASSVGDVFISATQDSLIFGASVSGVVAGGNTMVSYVAKPNTRGNSWDTAMDFGAESKFLHGEVGLRVAGSAGARNLAVTPPHFIYQRAVPGTSYFDLKIEIAAVPNPASVSAIKGLLPTGNEVTGQPSLRATVDTDEVFGQSQYRVQFQIANDVGFTTNLVDYLQPASKQAAVNGTNVANTVVYLSDILPSNYVLTFGQKYYRARLVNEFGQSGAWTTTYTFIVAHAPTMIPVSPINSFYYAWGTGARDYVWRFTDTYELDYQTAYQFVLYDDLGAVIFDSGKVTSADQFINYAVNVAYKDRQLQWQVKGWDSNDSAGPFSELQPFILTDPPAAVITTPISEETVATGVPTINLTVATGGGRSIKEVSVSIFQGGQIVWTSPKRIGPFLSGTALSFKVQQGFLQNNQSYTLQASITDTGNAQGVSSFVPFSVAWIPPLGPDSLTVDNSYYNIEDEGYVAVMWPDTNRDVDFTGWVLYRKDDLIDPDSKVVLEEGAFKVIDTVYDAGDLHAYKDYFAPSGYKVTYIVRQTVNRDGQDIESDNVNEITVYPISDGYWLIEPLSDQYEADAFRLRSVTGDSYTREQEEEEINVIGRGRVVNKGQKLGRKGSIDAKIRTTSNRTARQQILRLEKVQDALGQLWLRDPFGNIFKVNVGQMSFTRVAGVGLAEFADVTIPYAEVS